MRVKQVSSILILLASVNLLSIANFSAPTFDEFARSVFNAKHVTKSDRGGPFGLLYWPSESLITRESFTQTYNEFKKIVTQENQASSSQARSANWINDESKEFFATKISVDPKSQVAFHGDLHGDIHSLIGMIKFFQKAGIMTGFNIKPEHKDLFYLVFLGDYVDRGIYGLEVLYTLMRLKIDNPDNVFLLRGNHEDIEINSKYGFIMELMQKKFLFFSGRELTSTSKEFTEKIRNIYTLFPSVLYISCADSNGNQNTLQCNHGGIEFGFNPKSLLGARQKQAYCGIEKLDRESMINKISELKTILKDKKQEIEGVYYKNLSAIHPTALGFLWNDFVIQEDKKMTYTPGRGLALGKQITEEFLNKISTDKIKMRGIFRAHQHSGDMMNLILNSPDGNKYNGVAKLWRPEGPIDGDRLWDKIVCTLNAPPFSAYGKHFRYDTFIILRLANDFSDWRMVVQHTEANFFIPEVRKYEKLFFELGELSYLAQS